MKKTVLKNALQTLCNLLIIIAPLMVSETACFSFWGEAEVPESLK